MKFFTDFWAWLKSYNASTHALALAGIALPLAFKGYQPFHDLVMQVYDLLPGYVHVLVGTGLYLWALYKTGALTLPPASK